MEIMFRGKARGRKFWVFGDHGTIKNGDEIIHTVCGCVVEEESVGQYTGKNDIFENRVFAGDILLWSGELDGIEIKEYSAVVWDENVAGYVLESADGTLPENLSLVHEMVVVGRVFDNPNWKELFKTR